MFCLVCQLEHARKVTVQFRLPYIICVPVKVFVMIFVHVATSNDDVNKYYALNLSKNARAKRSCMKMHTILG